METIAMMSRYDLESLKRIAKYLFGIEKEMPAYVRPTVTPREMLEKSATKDKKLIGVRSAGGYDNGEVPLVE